MNTERNADYPEINLIKRDFEFYEIDTGKKVSRQWGFQQEMLLLKRRKQNTAAAEPVVAKKTKSAFQEMLDEGDGYGGGGYKTHLQRLVELG